MKRAEVGHAVFVWRLLCVACHLLAGVVQIVLFFAVISEAERARRIRRWSRQLLMVCGVRTEVYGRFEMNGAGMVVANHISWLDIFVLSSCGAVHFVAKSEIKRWFLLGFLTRHTGAVFVERHRRGGVADALKNIDTLLAAGKTVAVFPEGTTGSGESVKPFKSSLLQAVANADCPLMPVALRYPLPDGRCNTQMAYYGSVTLWQSLCQVLRGRHNVAELYCLPPLSAQAALRTELATTAHQQIADCLRTRASAQRQNFACWRNQSPISEEEMMEVA